MRVRRGTLCLWVCVFVATLGVPITPAVAATPSAQPPAPPVAARARVSVDMLKVRTQKLSWSHAGPGFVKIYAPGEVHPYPTRFPATGTFSVRTANLPIGRSTFYVSYCNPTVARTAPVCSAGTPVTFVVGPAQFQGAYRKFVPAARDLRLSWSGSGNVWHVIAPSLGISTWLTKPGVAIPAANVTAGAHEVSLVSCTFTARPRCSNRFDVNTARAGTVRFIAATGERVAAGQTVARITPTRGGAARDLKATRLGVFHRSVDDRTRVGAHVSIGRVITGDVGRTEIVAGAGASVPTWTNTNWEGAFTAQTFDGSARPTTGSPLDVTFDSAGDIWQVGEFSQAIALVEDGKVTDVASPVGQDVSPASATDIAAAQSPTPMAQARGDAPVRGLSNSRAARAAGAAGSARPYAMNMFGADLPTSMSVLGERVIDTGSAVWYTQGGELFYKGAHANHSTLIKVTYGKTGRSVCSLAVPGDNNQVIGIAYDRATKRVWFTESHAGHASALDWFVDDGSMPCNNNLNYSDPNAVAAASAANRCTRASQTRCIHHIDLPASAGVAGHITIDSSDGYAWFVDFTGRHLNRYPLDGGELSSFPLPISASAALFNGFPWAIQADENAVYLNRYSDNTLLRLDKHASNGCDTLTRGDNPCIAELFLPMLGPDSNAHSIALVGDRLWFTIANESTRPTHPNASAFGWIDTASWAEGAPTGTYYDDLTTLGAPPANAHHSFRGITVTPAGNVALADSGYKSIVSLTPR